MEAYIKVDSKGLIIVNVQHKSDDVIIEIIDNGIGREKANSQKLKSAQKKKSMGMQITRDRKANYVTAL